MFEILKLNKISDKIYNVFDKNYKVSNSADSPDAIMVRSYQMADYPINDNLLAIGRAGAGVNNIPLPRMTDAGVVVFNTPGANANAVKELTVCAMLLASRDIVSGISWQSTLIGMGPEVPKLVEKGKAQFGGIEIAGKTLGIIGLGAIGLKVANAAVAMDMRVIGCDPYLTKENQARLDRSVSIISLEEVLSQSDFVTLHVPYIDATKYMINAQTIAKMKTGAVLINLSRGELVNNEDIKVALENGKIRRYVVDFPTEDIIGVPKIISIPHLGASTEEAEDNCAVMAAAQVKDYLENGNIKNSVNFPNLSIGRRSAHRLTITYNAGKGVIEKITAVLGNADYTLNFAEKKTIGYAIIDTDKPLGDGGDSQSIVEEISDLEDIINIRIL
ncbi:MAG: 3-phosphoglycerate dehydrogenase family protein [Clostridia bacterium]|nr:3-phosphoglycerate dehydrogenase family protein [Clostridia bacterium]